MRSSQEAKGSGTEYVRGRARRRRAEIREVAGAMAHNIIVMTVISLRVKCGAISGCTEVKNDRDSYFYLNVWNKLCLSDHP